MLERHLGRHALGVFPGEVPVSWLQQHGRFVCRCGRLVAESRRDWHRTRCPKEIAGSYQETERNIASSGKAEYPTLDEVFSLNRPTLKHIPKRARQRFGKVLAACFKKILTDNSTEAWVELAMLAKCVLPSVKRGGKSHKLPDINRLCDRWSEGEQAALWAEAKQHSVNIKPRKCMHSSEHARISAAISLAEDGLYSKACRVLTSNGIASNTPETWQKLVMKHPNAEPPAEIPDTAPLQLSNEFNLEAVLHSFPADTACGPSGLRVQHLLEANEASLMMPLTTILRQVVNLLLRGDCPSEVAPFLAGANLTALRKGEQDVRPIAAGEVLRRLASKCACLKVQAKAKDFFKPSQFGVACPAGREKIIHRARFIVEQHWHDADFVILKVDMANAFNTVHRGAVLGECHRHFPELLSWVKTAYRQHPKLWHTMGTLSSQTGVQQGDPLGPLLFSLVIASLVPRLDPSNKLLLHAWYLDDGLLCGPSAVILRAIKTLREATSWTGLSLKLEKCELFSRSDLSIFPDAIQRSNLPEFELLGSPIGDARFCERYIEGKRSEATELMEALRHLHNPQVALALLRSSASFCRLSHLARCAPPDQSTRAAFRRFDENVRNCFEECLGLETTDESWRQAQLGLRRGGFGLRSLERHASAAFIASYVGSVDLSLNDGQRHLPVVIEDAIFRYNTYVQEDCRLSASQVASVAKLQQRVLSAHIDDKEYQEIMESASPINQVRLHSITADHASAWLCAVPSPGLGLTIPPDAMSVLTKWWLGLPVSPDGASCSRCPNHALDPSGHHALTCKRGPYVTARHNALRDCLANYCRQALLNPTLEAGAGLDDRQTRPADILLPTWTLGASAALDLTVVHPLNTTNLTGASTDGGSVALAAAAERKHEENSTKCRELGWACIPMPITTYGEWGEEAEKTISRICERLSITSGARSRQVHDGVRRRLSVVLMRANGRALLASLCPGLGRAELEAGGCAEAGEESSYNMREERRKLADAEEMHERRRIVARVESCMRDEEWDKERAERQRLMQEVLDEHSNRIAEQLDATRRKQAGSLMEREQLVAEVEFESQEARAGEEKEERRAQAAGEKMLRTKAERMRLRACGGASAPKAQDDSS